VCEGPKQGQGRSQKKEGELAEGNGCGVPICTSGKSVLCQSDWRALGQPTKHSERNRKKSVCCSKTTPLIGSPRRWGGWGGVVGGWGGGAMRKTEKRDHRIKKNFKRETGGRSRRSSLTSGKREQALLTHRHRRKKTKLR